MKYHFIGIGGSGMIGLARIMRARGCLVQGSDRSYDADPDQDKFRELEAEGILLTPQDGSGISADIDAVVASTAVEDSVPDAAASRRLGLRFLRRAELLAELVNCGCGVAVAGTSGKTTMTGMIEAVLRADGRDPTVINGGLTKIRGLPSATARAGASPEVVAEADESDGSIELYRPRIGVVSNITLDHKPIPELLRLFQGFADQTAEALVLGGDDERVRSLRVRGPARPLYFGFGPDNQVAARDVRFGDEGAEFETLGVGCRLRVPGRHNVLNALAAAAVGLALGAAPERIAAGLASFEGIGRRLELVGRAHGVRVVDDFGHNPDKIRASIRALRPGAGRLIVVFQPHGFGPTRLMKDELVRMFADELGDGDLLYLLPIFYAGGTAVRDISSEMIAEELSRLSPPGTVSSSPDRERAAEDMASRAQAGDVVAVMGARDDTLSVLAADILRRIEARGRGVV